MRKVASRQGPVASMNLGAVVSPQSSPATGDWRPATSEGVILIALLWILTALSVIALSFSRESFVEVSAARNAQSLENSYFVARAGMAATTYQLLQRMIYPQARQADMQEAPDPLDLGLVTGSFGGGIYQVNIQDESGKLNVNQVSEQQLRALMEAVGINKEEGDIITDSILDWKDPDSAHRLNGAEDDYYESLNPPYKAKNTNIETIEELLLIRGVTPEYFYGRPERDANGSVIYKYGLSRYLTVYSQMRNQVNVNSAPLAVLMSLPGMSADAARAIYERRHVKPFKSIMDISRELGVSLDTNTGQFLTFGQTDTYSLTASAHAANSKVRRVIRAVVRLEPGARTKPYRVLYWNENIPDYEGMTP